MLKKQFVIQSILQFIIYCIGKKKQMEEEAQKREKLLSMSIPKY